MKWLKNIKARYLWIAFAISVIICGLLIFLCIKINNKNISLVILIISFLISGFIFQEAIAKSMIVKTKKKIYNPKKLLYDGMDKGVEELRKNAFNSTKFSYGTSFIKIKDNIAYKVLFVKNLNNYNNPTDDDKNKPVTKGIDNCSKMINIEIFFDYDNELESKIGEFSFVTTKLLFKGFYVKDNELIDPDFKEIEEEFINYYNWFIDLLGIKYEEENISD